MHNSSDLNNEIHEPVITCPVCRNITQEGELTPDMKTVAYFDDTCQKCGTRFRLGEVSEKCALCQQPFPFDHNDDINQNNNHWCRKDNQSYCTPCYMQLFFDGYIDLSSVNEDIDDDGFDGLQICTSVGVIAPYQSRLAAKGYELVGCATEWNQAKQLCKQIAGDGHRFLVLETKVGQADQFEYQAYRNSDDRTVADNARSLEKATWKY